MGPAKGSRTVPKIIIKGYEDHQLQEDPTCSIKVKLKKRKMSDLGPQWSRDELMRFYEAYRHHGKNWKKISVAVSGKSADMAEALYNAHRTFLSLPEREGTSTGFIALVTGHHNVLDESPSHKEREQTIRTSGKGRKRREAARQKENEAPQSHHEMRISGFSSSFRKRYFGDLARCIRRNPAGTRTPRVLVIFPSDINSADDTTPEIKNVISSTKKVNEEISNDGTIFSLNECSPDGSSGITDANKIVQGQTFLEIKGTGDTEISQAQHHLKKRRTEQSMDEGQTSKVDHESTMAAERNNLVDYQSLSLAFSPDEMLVLVALDSMVTVPSNIPNSQSSTPSGILGKNISASSQRRKEGFSPVDLPKQRKQVSEYNASKTRKKRRKKLLDEEVLAEDQNNSGNTLVLPEPRQVDTSELPSLNSEFEKRTVDLPEATVHFSAEVSPDAPTKINPERDMSMRSKRKSKVQCRTKYVLCNDGADSLQAMKLLHCLSSEPLRRWCTHEWFYSAVDYPWYMNNEFVNYLNFAKLSHLSRLTRSEWSTIRSSLGKPRRFSNHFLAVEKEKLEVYRENVRNYYAELNDGSRDSLPADLAQPFSVGQQVIVRSPSTRELYDGKVVMVERDCYNVQFDRPDLSVQIVKDTDCMPVNWSDNLLHDLKKRRSLSNNALIKLDTESILEPIPEEGWDHRMDGLSISELSRNSHIKSDERIKVKSDVDGERLPNKSTVGTYAPLIQHVDGKLQSSGVSNTSSGHDDDLDSYITQFVQNSLSQAKHMVGEVMQEISENGNDSREEGTCTLNQTMNCVRLEPETAPHDAQLPADLILNCIATVLAIKDLSEYQHPPANIAGVLDRAFSMLRPSCSENLAIYNEIESCIAVVKNQMLARVPTSGNGSSSSMLM